MPDARCFNPPLERNDRPVMPKTPVLVGAATVVGMPSIIVYVHTSRKKLKQFARACHSAGLAFALNDRECPEWCAHWGLPAPIDGINGWEVIGTPDALEALTEHESIDSWHAVGFVKPSVNGQGNTKKR